VVRVLRLEFEGALYHLCARGNRREEILRDDWDLKSFLQTFGAACEKINR
jgi:REP element-mobilizing transposase RayT